MRGKGKVAIFVAAATSVQLVGTSLAAALMLLVVRNQIVYEIDKAFTEAFGGRVGPDSGAVFFVAAFIVLAIALALSALFIYLAVMSATNANQPRSSQAPR